MRFPTRTLAALNAAMVLGAAAYLHAGGAPIAGPGDVYNRSDQALRFDWTDASGSPVEPVLSEAGDPIVLQPHMCLSLADRRNWEFLRARPEGFDWIACEMLPSWCPRAAIGAVAGADCSGKIAAGNE